MAAALATGGAPNGGGGTGGNGGGRRGAAQTYGRLQWGDLVAFYVEDKGFVATPSIEEPIPLAPSLQPPPFIADNRDDHTAIDATSPPLSHLRAARPLHRGTKVPADFHNRCIWEVLSEGGLKATDEPVTYGSTIQLRHTKTGFLITVDCLGGGVIQSMGMGPHLTSPPAAGGAGTGLHDTAARVFTRLRNPGAAFAGAGGGARGAGGGRGGGGGGGETSAASQFYLRPRYSVRAEGDFVRDQDRVIFESCRFKGLQLCLERGAEAQTPHAASGADIPHHSSHQLPSGIGMGNTGASFALLEQEQPPPPLLQPEGVVSVSDDAYLRSGWQIHLVSRARLGAASAMVGIGREHLLLSANPLGAAAARAFPAAGAAAKAAGAVGAEGSMGASALEEGAVICGGDFVRFAHQEIIGHLIARVDDGAERCSRISPLGMVYRKLQLERERATGVFLRRGAAQPSALSIFQVIPQQVTSGQPVEWDAPVRLRHLLSGQFLALRPEHPADSASIRASAKLTHVRAAGPPPAAAAAAAGPIDAAPSAASSRPTTAGTEESGATGSSGISAAAGMATEGSITSPPLGPSAPLAAAALDLVGSSSLDLSVGSEARGTPTLFASGGGGAAAGAAGGPLASASGGQAAARVKLVVATVSDPEDPATLFRLHPVRDADTAFVTSKSKALLVHHETGAHLSLGRSEIAQHGKMSGGLVRGDRPGTGGGGGGGGGMSFASVAMAARAAAAFKHDEEGRGERSEEDEAQQQYWEYENDSLVFASCEDDSDADVYRIYPVKAATTRNLLYALRFQPIIAEAVDIVRGMRLDVLHPAPPTLVASTGAAPGAGPHPAFFGTATPTTPAGAEPGAVEALASSGLRRNSGPRAGALLRSPTLLSQRQPSSSTLRLTRGSVGNGTMNGTLRPDEVYVAACQHLLYALHELLLWQAGDIDADGEIQRRDGVPLFAFLGGDDGSVRLYASDHLHGGPGHQDMPGGTAAGGGGNTKKGSMFTSASVAGGGASSCASSHPSARGRDLMEKDEDSFDRDMTWRRRELLRDTHVVEQLLMFISVAFQLYRGRTYARTREELLLAAARGDTAAPAVVAATEAGAAETAGADAVPDAHLLAPDAIPLIDACCRYAYRLLRVMMTSSCALTVLYLAGVNSMVRHISLGWDPPIEEILAAAIGQDRVAPTASKPKGAANNSSATTSNRLSCSDLYQLVLELYASYMKKEITGVKFLKLLANVCAPGNVVDPKVQSFLAGLILHTKRKAGGGASSASSAAGAASPPSFTPEELAEVPEVTSLLFSLRPGGAQGGWRVHLSLMQEKPLYTPDSHEMDLFSEAERGMIKEAFNRYDEDGNGAIDQQELGLLLQDLGLQSLIVEEVQSRWTGSIGFEQFCSWWHQHRHILETWSSPFEFFSPASAPSPAPASAAAGGGSRPGIGAGDVGPKAAASPAAVPSPLAPSPAPTAATTAPGDLPPALAISSISPNIGHGGRLPSLSSPLAGSPASDKAPSPLSTMKHRAAKSTHALPPRSLTVDEEEIGEQDVFAMPDAIFRRWIDIELIFTHERFAAEARWIRASVRLMIALCREQNLVSQKLVGAIVPVDAILHLLHSNALREADKALFCDLLRTLYIEHDLIFPVSPLLPHQAACLSLDPEQASTGEMGRVFNPLSQATLSLAAVGSSPRHQRAGLRALLAVHLGKLEGYVGLSAGAGRQQELQLLQAGGGSQREAFAASLLRLTHALLLRGFFEAEAGRRPPRGAGTVTDAGGGMSVRSLGGHSAGLLTSFFGGRAGAADDEDTPQGRASEWGPPVAMDQAVAASAAAAAAASSGVPSLPHHVRFPKGLLGRLVSPRRAMGAGKPASPIPPGSQHALTYSFLEATLILTLEAAGRATVARAKAASGGDGVGSLQDLQVSGGGAFRAVFDEPGPIALKTEVVGLLRTLADIRALKNAKALLSSFRVYESSGGSTGPASSVVTASGDVRDSVRASLALGGRDSTTTGGAGGGGSRVMAQLRFGLAQEAVLDRGFDDRSADGEVFIQAVLGTTAHRDKSLLVRAYDLLYRHSTQRVAFAALLDELDVSRRPSLAITMRTQRLALELFEKHLPGFHQRAAVSCDVLTYLLHLLTRLCYRNWDVESLAASMVSRRVRPVDLEAVFASSGDEGGAAGAHHGRDPFGSGKPPYVNAEALGLDDACSLPIRAQQEELQRAGRRVAAFLARVLQTDAGGAEHGDGLGHSHGGGGGGGLGLLKKASTLGNSSACASTGSSFHSAVLHVTGAPSAMPTTATVPAPSLVQLTSEQRRVVSEGFAFLYHSCRGQPDLLQGTALPILHVLRAYAPEFPYAMRLLAALARGTGRAAGLGIQDVDVLLTRCIGGGGGDGAGLSPEMQTEALGLVRAVLEAEGGAAAAWSPEGGYEGEGDHQYHRQYTVSSGPSRPAHAPDRELWALKAAVLEAVWRRLLLGDDGSAGGDGGAAVDFSLAAMALVETPRSSSKRKHPQQPSSAASSSSSSPTSWRLPQASLAARDWAFKAEGLALVRACLEAAAQLERAQTIAEEELDVEGPSPVFDSVLGRGGSVGATMATADSPAPLKLDAVQGVKERVAVLYPPEDCLAAAMDAHMPLPVRTLLLRLVKLQAFVATDRPRAPAPPALSDEASGSSSSSRASSRLSPAHHHGGAHPHPARPAAASPPPPPLEEVGARLAAAAAASTRTFELMQTFAGRCQLEVEAFRRSIRLGMVTMKEMEGMAALPYLVKAVPAFVLAFLRRQGCGPDVQEALQLSLASARRKLEKEQGRSRLWKATEGVLPQKVAKALLMDGSGEEVMAWIVDTFVHTGHHHDRRGRAAGLAAADGASSTDVSVSGHPTALGRVASSMALHGGMVSKQSSGRSLLQQLHSQFPVSAPAIHHQQQQPPQSQPQEPEPASLQLKVLGQMLGLIERLAGLVLCVPALQAQWASAPEPVAQSLLVLLAFGAMAERVYHMRGSPQQLAALAMGRAPSRVSDGAGAGARGFYRKGTLDGSTASRGESLAPGAQSIASGLLGATLSSLPGIGIGICSGNSGAATTINATAAATAGNATSAYSRFILYLTQALEARRAAARAAAEEEELLRRQLPVAMNEARSYVLNVYEPPEVDDGNGNRCIPAPGCVPTAGGKVHATQSTTTATNITTMLAPSSRTPARPNGSSSIGSGARHDDGHGHQHHHRRPPPHSRAISTSEGGGVRTIPYPPTTAPRECALARVLWRQFQGFHEFFYEDAAFWGGEEEQGGGGLYGGGGGATVDEVTRLRRQRQHQQYQQQLHQLLHQPLMTQAGSAGDIGGIMSLLDDEDFRAWSKSGGLFLEHILLMIRYRLSEAGEEDCCLFFLNIVTKFLDDGLARIRRDGASRFDAQRVIKLVQAEVHATQRRQHALQALDAHTVLMALVAQAAQPSLGTSGTADGKAAHLLKVMPRVLRFGARLMATGNRQVQESIMDFQDRATAELLVQRKFCTGLRSLLRFCRYQIETLMYSSSSSSVLNNAGAGAGTMGAGMGGGGSEAEAFEVLVAESQPALELMTTLFDFLGALCAGHNMRARTFLREQRLSGDNVNLVAESASLLFTTCSYARTLMTYVQNRTFASKVAPPVHASQAKKTGRRFIAWHYSPRKFAHLADLLRVLGHGFACVHEMVQGPCHENQVICERLCAFAGEIVEYCGTLHLELPSQWTHGRVWVGGDPLKFYELYVREMARVGAGNGSSEAPSATAAAPPPVAPPFMSVAAAGVNAGAVNGGVPSLHHHHHQQEAEEREAALIVESLRQWRRVGERKLFGLHLHVTKAISALGARAGGRAQQHQQHQQHQGGGARASLAATLASKDILGVDLGEFTAVCLHTEKSCLKFLTAMLEGQSPGVVDHVRGSIDCWILFQNMDSLARGNGASSSSSSSSANDATTSSSSANAGGTVPSSERQRKAERQEAAVLYLTILSTLASLSGVQGGGEYGARMTKALEEWQEPFAKQGGVGGDKRGLSMLVSSVEIVGADGQVQVVFFPVPEWIKTYWSYPLVQKAKDELAYGVNRASPEEKILDFNDRMVVLTKVMRRQELLHKIFSIFHGFVGGKSLADARFLPSPRAILLCLTLLLNVWLCTRLYYKDNAGESSTILSTILSWNSTPSIIYAIKIAHLALCLSLLFTAALNSGAGDAVRGHRLKLLGGRRAVSFDWLVSLVIVLNDVRWLLVMSVLSSVGLWVTEVTYAFCVVDVIPQIRLMAFLLEAVTRNSHKIWLTVLLTLTMLYVFSTIAYLVFHNEYGFVEKYDCNSLATCFKLHVDYGIAEPPTWRGSGAINPEVHTTLVQGAQEQGTFDFAMTIIASLFNLVYVIIVNLVLTAIVAGLIIDTFGQMRSENEAIEEDMQEKCFICSIDRDLIESAGISFRDHIRHQHNMWSYFFFRTYLYGKDPLTFTGPEHYAFQMFKDRRNLTRFFPLKKSLIIERKKIELKSKSEVDVLAGRVGSVETQLAKLSLAVERLAEAQAGMGTKLAQEQHQLVGGVGEAVEAIKALQQQWTLQQQQAQQAQHASTATRAFLSKVTMAQRERQQQQQQQQQQRGKPQSSSTQPPSDSGGAGGGGRGEGGSPPRSASRHWRVARTGLAKPAARVQEHKEEDVDGGK